MIATSSGRLTIGLTRVAIPSAVVLALVGGLAGCRGVVVASSPTGGSVTTAAASTSAASSVASAASVAGTAASTSGGGGQGTASASPGPGSVSVSATSPLTVSGSATVPVSCVAGLAYRATVTSAVVQGDQLSFSVAVARYRGPGSYPAVVGVTLRQASGVVTTVAGVSRIPAAITSAGGSFSVSATGSGGRTLTGSLSWTCGE
jgi:hypothetical protein